MTPLARYQRDLGRIRALGPRATQLDALFHHRIARFARKDGTVSYLGQRFELPYELAGKTVRLVVDAHAQRVIGVEDDEGCWLGEATPLDEIGNTRRARRKAVAAVVDIAPRSAANLVEIAHRQYHGLSNKED